MGKSTVLVLFNGTPYTWKKNDISHSYQMEQYENNFPDSISSGMGSPNIWVEVKSGAFVKEANTGGEVGYDIQAPGEVWKFQIKVNDDPPRLRFESQGFGVKGSTDATPSFGYQSMIDLGFNWDRETYFILSGNGSWGGFSNIFSGIYVEDFSWMQNNLSYLGRRKLRQICIPGSHDAGMGEITRTDLPQSVIEPITRCQETTIKRQLQLGSRFFDIRPAISGGEFFTGHYSSDNNMGARGQSLNSIISEINDFTRTRSDLIILSVSGGRQTDKSFRRFENEEWKELVEKLSGGLNHLFNLPNGQEDGSLLDLTLNDFIGNKAAAVVVIMRDFKDLGGKKGKGFFTWEQCRFRDDYTNTEDLDKMVNDQIEKMKAHKDEETRSGVEKLSVLSWTLTPGSIVSSLLAPLVNVFDPIIPNQLKGEMEKHNVKNLAQQANRILLDPTKLFNRVTRNAFPNVLYLDYMDNTPVLALAMAINGYTSAD